MTFENITVKKLLSLDDPDQYEMLLYLKPSDELKGRKAKDLFEIEYGKVIEIRQYLERIELKGLVDMFEWVFGITEKQLMNLTVKEFYPAFNHIINETGKLVEGEEHLSDPDPIWSRAGGEKMAKYGVLGVLISLAQQFNNDIEDIEKWTYGKVFMLLRWNKDYSEVTENYHRIKSKMKR